MQEIRKARSLALVLMLFGAGCAGCAGSSAGCSQPAADDADTSLGQLTVTDGAQFVVSAEPEKVVLKLSTGDCDSCKLLDALRRDSQNKIRSLDDLVGKAILIHPLEGKADDGAFMRVENISKRENFLTLEGTPIGLEEIDDLQEDDVVRVYMDRKLPRGSTTTAAFAPTVAPMNFGFDSPLRPAGFGGLLAGGAPTVILWKGVRPQIDFLGFITPYISDMSFRPEVKLDWKRGRGLEVGLQMDLATEFGIHIDGILGANGLLFKQSVETPDVTMLVPGGLALPFKLTFSSSYQCNAVSGGKVVFNYKGGMKIHAGGSARIRPDFKKAPKDWVSQGEWPFAVTGSVTSNVDKLDAEPSAGLLCMVRLNANFSPTWFPAGGLYITISPQMLLLVSQDTPAPKYSVNLGAGAWTKKDLAVELTVLRWTP